MKKKMGFVIILILLVIGWVAFFAMKKQEYSIEYEVENYDGSDSKGRVVGTRGVIKEGEKVKVRAIAESGYSFYYWELNDEIVSFDREWEIEVEEDAVYTAVFGIGTVKKIKNTVVVLEEKGAKITVADDESWYSLDHNTNYNKLGYWYEGENCGFSNGYISGNKINVTNSTTIKVETYRFNAAKDLVYMTMSEEVFDIYTQNKTIDNANALNGEGKFKYYGRFTTLNNNSQNNVTKEISLELNAGEYLSYGMLLSDGTIVGVSNHFYTGVGTSQTIGLKTNINDIDYNVSLVMTNNNA